MEWPSTLNRNKMEKEQVLMPILCTIYFHLLKVSLDIASPEHRLYVSRVLHTVCLRTVWYWGRRLSHIILQHLSWSFFAIKMMWLAQEYKTRIVTYKKNIITCEHLIKRVKPLSCDFIRRVTYQNTHTHKPISIYNKIEFKNTFCERKKQANPI